MEKIKKILLVLSLFLINVLNAENKGGNPCELPNVLMMKFNESIKKTLKCFRDKNVLAGPKNDKINKFLIKALSSNSISVRDYAIASIVPIVDFEWFNNLQINIEMKSRISKMHNDLLLEKYKLRDKKFYDDIINNSKDDFICHENSAYIYNRFLLEGREESESEYRIALKNIFEKYNDNRSINNKCRNRIIEAIKKSYNAAESQKTKDKLIAFWKDLKIEGKLEDLASNYKIETDITNSEKSLVSHSDTEKSVPHNTVSVTRYSLIDQSSIRAPNNVQGNIDESKMSNQNSILVNVSNNNISTMSGKDCEPFSLENNCNGKSVPIQDQGDIGNCYAHASSDLINYTLCPDKWFEGDGTAITVINDQRIESRNNWLKSKDGYTSNTFVDAGNAFKLLIKLSTLSLEKNFSYCTRKNIGNNFFHTDELNYLKRIYLKKISFSDSKAICDRYPLLNEKFIEFMKNFSNATESKKLGTMIRKNFFNCDNSLVDNKKIPYPKIFTENKDINIELRKTSGPMIINYFSSIYDDMKNGHLNEKKIKDKDHSSVIIGRRMKNGKCQVLIKNSYGKNWPKSEKKLVVPGEEIEEGSIWIDVDQIEKYTKEIIHF